MWVAPHAGVWIETSEQNMMKVNLTSHPMRVCGLKLKMMSK